MIAFIVIFIAILVAISTSNQISDQDKQRKADIELAQKVARTRGIRY